MRGWARSSSRHREAERAALTAAKMLEIGIVATLGVVAAAVGAYALSDIVGRARRAERHRSPAPAPGRVPATRHQNIAVASPR